MSSNFDISSYQEPRTNKDNKKLNWLRASVLGANDGIVSVASIIVGVAGASNSLRVILTAGIAGTVAGALSMGVGEYISVSTQRDTEEVLGVKPDSLTNPWHAAHASALSFICGAIVPIIMIIISPLSIRIPITFAGVLIALIIAGGLSAHAGGASKKRAIIRVVLGGVFAMAITFGIGKLFGISGI